MRARRGPLIGAVAAGLAALAGCTGGPAVPGGQVPQAGVNAAATEKPTGYASAAAPAGRGMTASARAAAIRFYGLYSEGQFSATWKLLAPTVRQGITARIWVGVHEGCSASGASKPMTVTAVTVFGDAAIITESIAGSVSEQVFNDVNGHWDYGPGSLSIYHHGSVTADISAARAAGFCGGSKVF
ncbi:MAG TPA: hypothetical protein VN969_30100 [Streptosporangiaceae bacterium]|jgi:hypothetical protein|nr:hypothetical protein [Streptosporangiaceae bacterium]